MQCGQREDWVRETSVPEAWVRSILPSSTVPQNQSAVQQAVRPAMSTGFSPPRRTSGAKATHFPGLGGTTKVVPFPRPAKMLPYCSAKALLHPEPPPRLIAALSAAPA